MKEAERQDERSLFVRSIARNGTIERDHNTEWLHVKYNLHTTYKILWPTNCIGSHKQQRKKITTKSQKKKRRQDYGIHGKKGNFCSCCLSKKKNTHNSSTLTTTAFLDTYELRSSPNYKIKLDKKLA